MFGLLFVLASELSAADENAAVTYAQAQLTPALFEVCKSATPDKVDEFDRVLAQWQKTNASEIAHGEDVVRAQLAKEGGDLSTMLSAERDSTIAQLNAMDAKALIEQCDHILEVTRAEE